MKKIILLLIALGTLVPSQLLTGQSTYCEEASINLNTGILANYLTVPTPNNVGATCSLKDSVKVTNGTFTKTIPYALCAAFVPNQFFPNGTFSNGNVTITFTIYLQNLLCYNPTQYPSVYAWKNNGYSIVTSQMIITTKPAISFNFAGICKNGAPIILNIASPAGGTYTGAGVTGGKLDPTSSDIVIGSNTITYFDTVNGCGNSANKVYTVFAAPTDIPVLGDYEGIMCKGSGQTLKITNLPSDTVKWYDNYDNFLGKGATYSINNITQDITFKIKYNDVHNCISENVKNAIIYIDRVKANFSVPAQTVKLGGTIAPINTSSDASIYKWVMSGTSGTEQTLTTSNPVFNCNISGSKSIKLVAYSSNDCRDSITKPAIITVTTAVNHSQVHHEVRVYPNPMKNIVNIDFTGIDKDAAIALYNPGGIKILEKHLKKATGIERIDVSILPKGIYILELVTEGNSTTIKLEK